MHQMRLAETNTAVKKQRVVCTTRILSYLKCRSLRELVALAGNERLKCKVRLQAGADDQAVTAPWPGRRKRGSDRLTFRRGRTRTHLDCHDGDVAAVLIT